MFCGLFVSHGRTMTFLFFGNSFLMIVSSPSPVQVHKSQDVCTQVQKQWSQRASSPSASQVSLTIFIAFLLLFEEGTQLPTIYASVYQGHGSEQHVGALLKGFVCSHSLFLLVVQSRVSHAIWLTRVTILYSAILLFFCFIPLERDQARYQELPDLRRLYSNLRSL